MPKALKAALILAWVAVVGIGCGGDDENNPVSDADATLERAWQAYARKDFSTALIEFERASKLDPASADAKNGVGWTQLSLVDGTPNDQTLELVVGAFRDALRQNTRFADAWVGLGHALFLRRGSKEDYLDAANAFESALKADTTSLYRHDYAAPADVYALEAWCYYYAGDADTARVSADKALAKDPNAPSASLLIELLRLQGGR
jgi:Tfp pilus assembly protein PilF